MKPKKPTRRRLNITPPKNPSQDLPDVAPGVEQDQQGRPGPSEPIGQGNPATDPQKDNPTSFPGEHPPGPSNMGKEPPPPKFAYEPDRDLHPALHPDFIPDGEPD